MAEKADCYECKYRGTVPGSCHSKCEHPACKQVATDHPMIGLLAMLGGNRGGVGCVSPQELNIKADPHGIASGWFSFPFNFDPVWLENCDGFIAKDAV